MTSRSRGGLRCTEQLPVYVLNHVAARKRAFIIRLNGSGQGIYFFCTAFPVVSRFASAFRYDRWVLLRKNCFWLSVIDPRFNLKVGSHVIRFFGRFAILLHKVLVMWILGWVLCYSTSSDNFFPSSFCLCCCQKFSRSRNQ